MLGVEVMPGSSHPAQPSLAALLSDDGCSGTSSLLGGGLSVASGLEAGWGRAAVWWLQARLRLVTDRGQEQWGVVTADGAHLSWKSRCPFCRRSCDLNLQLTSSSWR